LPFRDCRWPEGHCSFFYADGVFLLFYRPDYGAAFVCTFPPPPDGPFPSEVSCSSPLEFLISGLEIVDGQTGSTFQLPADRGPLASGIFTLEIFFQLVFLTPTASCQSLAPGPLACPPHCSGIRVWALFLLWLTHHPRSQGPFLPVKISLRPSASSYRVFPSTYC